MNDTSARLAQVEARLAEVDWKTRVEAANGEARELDAVLSQVRSGTSRTQALKIAFPDRPLRTVTARLARYEAGGPEALISRRLPPPRDLVTPEVMQLVRGMLTIDPELRAAALCTALRKHGIEVAESTLREHLHAAGLSHPVGRPSGQKKKAEPLPLAGAELLKAVELELGAVRRLTETLGVHLDQLPPPDGEMVDDRANRDENGRFLAAYNEPAPRAEPELGGKFETVERHRNEKNLSAMRVANSSFEARYRKDLALTLLPIVVDAPRWSVLQHWQGEHLGGLVGVAYQPATLDKHARELKLAGASGPARDAVAKFWMAQEDAPTDKATGAVVVYCDAVTKPVWTHHFTRCTKVSRTNRVMPAISTVFLHSGAGTPLLYREFSGHASVPQRVPELLAEYETIAGEGTVRRAVVLDRESHAVWLFKELDEKKWTFIVPLRKSVVGPKAKFEELSEWSAYEQAGDEVRDAWLSLNDSRTGESALRTRVVARRRHRTGNVAWYATNAPRDAFSASDVIRLYFDRWPLQESVFREGSGRVGLEVHHGYGKQKVTDVAIVDQLDNLAVRVTRAEADRANVLIDADSARQQADAQRTAIARVEARLAERTSDLDARLAAGQGNHASFRSDYQVMNTLREWLPRARRELAQFDADEAKAIRRGDSLTARLAKAEQERARLEGRRRIFTVDTELDQIMTAYKLTFMNLAQHLMRNVLGEEMELETLIRGVLTLPGERVCTPTTDTVRIYRQSRDPRCMSAVERGCKHLNALNLVQDKRKLRFELVDPP